MYTESIEYMFLENACLKISDVSDTEINFKKETEKWLVIWEIDRKYKICGHSVVFGMIRDERRRRNSIRCVSICFTLKEYNSDLNTTK